GRGPGRGGTPRHLPRAADGTPPGGGRRHPPPRPVRGPAPDPRPGGRPDRPSAPASPRRADPGPGLRGEGPAGDDPARAGGRGPRHRHGHARRRTRGGTRPPGRPARRGRGDRGRPVGGGGRGVAVLRPAGGEDPGPAALAHRLPGPGGAEPMTHPTAATTTTGRRPDRQARAIRLGPRSWLALALVSAVGVAGFGWPFLAPPTSTLNA